MFLFIQNKTAILKVTVPSKASFANYGCFCINPFVLLTLAQLRYLYRSFANVISLKKTYSFIISPSFIDVPINYGNRLNQKRDHLNEQVFTPLRTKTTQRAFF